MWRASQSSQPEKALGGGERGAGTGLLAFSQEEGEHGGEDGDDGEEADGAFDASCMSSSLERLLEDSGLSTLTADFGISLRSVEYQSGSVSFTRSALVKALRRGGA